MSKFKQVFLYSFSVCILWGVSANASAACTQADFAGVWKIYTEYGEDTLTEGRVYGTIACPLVVLNTVLSTSLSPSVCTWVRKGVKFNRALTGNLTVDATCHITGSITMGKLNWNVDASMSKGKDSLSGMMWGADKSGFNHVNFSGEKR